MFEIAAFIALMLLSSAVTAVVARIVVGPTLADRVLALDYLTLLSVGLIGVYAVHSRIFLYIDIAIALALVGFLSTAAFARYLQSRDRA